VNYEFLTATAMNIAVYWVVKPCSLVDVYQLCRVISHSSTVKMEAAWCSHTMISTYQITGRQIPGNNNLALECHLVQPFKDTNVGRQTILLF
jgi:hypothetical protein